MAPFSTLESSELRREVWRRTLRACGCEDMHLVEFAAETYRRLVRATYQPFPDVEWLFQAVRAAGVPVGLVTNGASDTQREKIEAMGIAAWFDAMAISGEIGIAKPEKAAFAPALDALAVSGKDVWHVGDNLETDVQGANAAGLTSVWLNRGGAERRERDSTPDIEISSLSALAPHLLDLQ